MKKCYKCKKEKRKFYSDKSTKDGLRNICADCDCKKGTNWHRNNKVRANATHRIWYKNNPSKIRASVLRRYGMTKEDYDRLLNIQNNKCAICEIDRSDLKKEFCIDHDHSSGQVRGLLCSGCNKGIGLLRDDSKICLKASEYLGQS
jgi:hypothetical protein